MKSEDRLERLEGQQKMLLGAALGYFLVGPALMVAIYVVLSLLS